MRVFYWHANRVRTNPEGIWPRTTPLVSEEDFVYSHVSTYNPTANCFQSIPVRVCVVIDDTSKFTHAEGAFIEQTIFSFNIDPLYKQCCGLREIGTIHVHWSLFKNELIPDIINKIKESFRNSNLFAKVGALTYTLVKFPNGNFIVEAAAKLMQAWPGASAGDWWYNPNSGNFVQIWTLPINQDRINANEDDDGHEDDD